MWDWSVILLWFSFETEGQFQQTVDLLTELRSTPSILAAYSPRPGTIAPEK